MTKKKNTGTAEEPKRIYKETIDIEVLKTRDEKEEAKEMLQELVMKKFSLENQIESCKKQLSGMKNLLADAAREAESDTKTEEVEALVKIYAKSMKKEIYVDDKLHATETASRWELQSDIDDLNYDESKEEDEEDEN